MKEKWFIFYEQITRKFQQLKIRQRGWELLEKF